MSDELQVITRRGTFRKLDNDRFEAEFDLFVKSEEERLIGGVVYEPDIPDAQDDWANAAEISKAAHDFLVNCRTVGVMHSDVAPDTHVVESFIAPVDFKIGKELIKKGTWFIVVKVLNDALWQEVKKGTLTGFSMGGTARYREERQAA